VENSSLFEDLAMRKKQVWRYYCEHCKKSGCSAPHIVRHERGCTNNPARICGVCRVAGLTAAPLPELMALCKAKAVAGESVDGNPEDSSLWLDEAAMKALRELADGCPVCALAALRQSNIFGRGFNMKEELKSLWADHNDAQMQREYQYG
jgi:hypothetical protein